MNRATERQSAHARRPQFQPAASGAPPRVRSASPVGVAERQARAFRAAPTRESLHRERTSTAARPEVQSGGRIGSVESVTLSALTRSSTPPRLASIPSFRPQETMQRPERLPDSQPQARDQKAIKAQASTAPRLEPDRKIAQERRALLDPPKKRSLRERSEVSMDPALARSRDSYRSLDAVKVKPSPDGQPGSVALPSVPLKPLAKRIVRPEPAAPELVPWLSARVGASKLKALRKFGGSEKTEHAVRMGLAYIASKQQPNGGWGSLRHRDRKYGETSIGKSGLALLAFLGAGHYPGSGSRYEERVRRAIAFLLAVQEEKTGHFGRSTSSYSHGIATYALGEAYLLTQDPIIEEAVRRGVDQILSNQVLDPDLPAAFGGWPYYYPDGRRYFDGQRYDTYPRVSISAWQLMALKTAHLGGIEFPEKHLEYGKRFLLSSWSHQLSKFLYNRDLKRLRSMYPTLPGSTPAATFVLLILGHDRDSIEIQGGVEMVSGRPPHSWARADTPGFIQRGWGNPYFWYYGTLTMFMYGGDRWQAWNDALQKVLLPAQEHDGSWEPISVYAEYAGDDPGDRTYTTTLNVLMLEVYYRYLTPFLKESKNR
ncbi:MAG: hypothetical protein V3T77_00620 [Planctomycetota bacterium]